MAESLVQVTEGVGKKLHTWSRTIGANTVEDEVVLVGEHHLATYLCSAAAVSIATANDHVLQLMAGASLNVYVRRIMIWQRVIATTAAIYELQLLRLTTAGTGGSAVTPAPLDTSDAASGAAGMTIPTVKGTEGVSLLRFTAMGIQTVPTGGPASGPLVADLNFDQLRSKGIRIAAGTANGIALKILNATAGAQLDIAFELVEANH